MKINKEGYRIIFFTIALSVAILIPCSWFLPLWIALLITLLLAGNLFFVAFFFREPQRAFFQDQDLVYAPADGKIVVVEEVYEKEYLHGKGIQISVFMSLTNVHVNWFPVSGTVEYFKYHPGKYMVAWHPKSSENNERTTTVVNTGKHTILFRQIAGFVARRIVSYAKVGEQAGQNTKCGFIKFGSRVDVILPAGSEVLVKKDEIVIGSQTPIAKLK